MKLHLESGTGLFETPAPLSPPSTRLQPPASRPSPSTSAVATAAPPTTATLGSRGTALPTATGSAIVRRPGGSIGSGGPGSESPPPRRGSTDGGEGLPNIGQAGGWKKKDWTETAASVEKGKTRGRTELLSSGGQGTEGWKKMKSFFSTSAHPLPSPPTVEVLQQQLQREQSERRHMEEELRQFKQRAGPLMYQLKRRYVECYDANKTLTLRNEHLERELEALSKFGKPGAPPIARDKKPASPEGSAVGTASGGRAADFMAREKMLEAREKKEWRNTRMMMVESHKTERLELMAQVEELREKLKGLTKDLLEVLDENEKLVKQLEIAEEERDKCIKLMESKVS
ncbi:uncharacterized protein ACA1_097670 [Acanthamoeba castellanii str. Neff]|uniref:Uncharacterized protein n=1 Tax=Acanthamoeba castellanii (strain ATCC 30010 / Neff) TaxID=1257118 RepID=L8GLL8_ACACF|nr:uncharacterized protein ACA1_097670 [Acanthamoeba castellanii str. Neff]ELR13081.1 hypothetical protein ACA1_097670 [Acanthamoeba castellanii str. Neff]